MAEWARRYDGRFLPLEKGYECSSRGDTRFSALFAKLPDGRTIEEAYQLDVKGYREQGDDWRLGKGKSPLNGKSKSQLYKEYLELWRTWTEHHPEDFEELCRISETHVLTDMFATSEVNQAAALADLINQQDKWAKT